MPVTSQQRRKINEEIAAARSSLAQKVLNTVAAEHLEGYIADEEVGYAVARGRKDDDIAYDNAINHVVIGSPLSAVNTQERA